MQEQMCLDAAAGNRNALRKKGAEKTGVITLAVKHCSNARAGGWHDALHIFFQAKPLVTETEILD